MQYADLHALISQSSSTRQYFLSLPVSLQLSLHRHNDYIHSAADLHIRAAAMERYEHALAVSESAARHTKHKNS